MTIDADKPDFIPLAECVDRMVYRIDSRNLAMGVFRQATGGFIGIREKFWNYSLFEEYHWEKPSFATVRPRVAIEMLPDEIEAKESFEGGCSECGASIRYDKSIYDRMRASAMPLNDPAHEWPWVCENGCEKKGLKPGGTYVINQPLFDYLSNLEVIEITESPAWAWDRNEQFDFEKPGSAVYRATRPLGHRGMKGGWGGMPYECGVCGRMARFEDDKAVGPATTEPCLPTTDPE